MSRSCVPGGCGCGAGPGCCAGVRAVTPRTVFQRPGLPALSARIGTHADFLETMVARLAAHPALEPLTVRSTDDPAVALLDCWAVVADTVTFSTERALDEGYLATATDPTSVLRLGRLVGYRPRPALAASGHLAFTLDPGTSGTVPAGTAVKSVPGPDELPQTFETSEETEVRAEWNRLPVRTSRPFPLSAGSLPDVTELTFVGASLNLRPGDLLVVDFGAADPAAVREIAEVTPDYALARTLARLVPLPDRPVGVAAALALVRDRAQTAVKAAQTPFQREVGAVLQAAASGLDQEPGLVLLGLAGLRQAVAEVAALGEAGRLSTADLDWVRGSLDPLGAAVGAAVAPATTYTRGRSPDLAYLERLAAAITCPDEETGRLRGRDCRQATPLLGTAVALAALRRPPTVAPARTTPPPQPLATALAPGSDGLRELLAGGDPRLAAALGTATATLPLAGPPLAARVIALRTQGHPVPDGPSGEDRLTLDGSPDNLVAGGWMVSRERDPDGEDATPAHELLTRVAAVQRFVRTVNVGDESATPVRVPSSLVLTTDPVLPDGGDVDVDDVTVWFGDQPLSLAEAPLTDPVAGGEIELAAPCPGLRAGRRLAVTGERSDVPGVTGVVASEVVVVGAVEQRVDLDLPGDVARPVLVLVAPLSYAYVRDTVVVHGNVAAATQGETRAEVLGSGRAGEPHQAFTLKQPTDVTPLTSLPSVSPGGADSTLTVRVDGVRWHPVELLADAGPRDPSYAVQPGPGPAATVGFGDGVHGSRLPNGVENVTATYRVGAGSSGNVGADRVRQLASRPLGVSAVTNPLPMTGGTRADSGDDGRDGAPLRTLALDRLVSVADHADFAAAHAGIAKAVAARLREPGREVVHVTVAAVDDAPLVPGDLLLESLESAFSTYGDPYLPVRVAVRDRLRLVLSAGLAVDPDREFADVAARVRARLLDELGFRRARLGQPVYLSRVVAAVQSTPGVAYVDVDAFGALSDRVDPVLLLREVTALGGVSDAVPARPSRVVHEEYVVGGDPTGEPDSLSTVALRHGLSLEELVALNPRLRTTVLTDGGTLVVADGPQPAQLACFDPAQPQTLVLRRIP